MNWACKDTSILKQENKHKCWENSVSLFVQFWNKLKWSAQDYMQMTSWVKDHTVKIYLALKPSIDILEEFFPLLLFLLRNVIICEKKNHFLSRYSYASILKNESHCLSWFPKVRPTFLCSSFSLVASVCFPRFSTRFRNHLPASSAFSCWPKYFRACLNDNCVFVFESSLSVLCYPCWDYKE